MRCFPLSVIVSSAYLAATPVPPPVTAANLTVGWMMDSSGWGSGEVNLGSSSVTTVDGTTTGILNNIDGKSQLTVVLSVNVNTMLLVDYTVEGVVKTSYTDYTNNVQITTVDGVITEQGPIDSSEPSTPTSGDDAAAGAGGDGGGGDEADNSDTATGSDTGSGDDGGDDYDDHTA